MNPAPVGAVVLAAGLGRRFGSAKMLAEWRGRPIVSYVLETIAAARDDGILSAGVVVHRPDDIETPRLAREIGIEPHLNTRPSRRQTIVKVTVDFMKKCKCRSIRRIRLVHEIKIFARIQHVLRKVGVHTHVKVFEGILF